MREIYRARAHLGAQQMRGVPLDGAPLTYYDEKHPFEPGPVFAYQEHKIRLRGSSQHLEQFLENADVDDEGCPLAPSGSEPLSAWLTTPRAFGDFVVEVD